MPVSVPQDPASEAVPQPPAPASGRLLGKTMWAAVAGVTTVGALLVANILVARSLGPEGTGQVAYYNWLAVFLATLGNLGLPPTLSRYQSELGGSRDAASAVALNRMILSVFLPVVLLAAGLIVLARQLIDPEGSPALSLLLAFYFLAVCGNGYYVNYLSGRQNFRGHALLSVANALLLVLFVTVGIRHFGVAGAVFGYMMGNAASLLMTFTLLRFLAIPAKLERDLAQRVRRYALHTWMSGVPGLFIWWRIEIFFLEQFHDAHAVAMFSTALTIVMLATQGPFMLTGALMPHFSEKVGEADLESVRRIYASATRLLSLLVFPSCFIAAAVAPVLVPLMYGEEFLPAVSNAVVLLLFAGFVTAATVGVSLLQAMERSRFLFLRELLGAVAAVGIYTVAIWYWGDRGAAWGRSLLQFSLVCVSIWYVSRRLNVPVPLGAVGRILGASAMAAAAAFVPVLLSPRPWSLAVALPLGCAVYGLMIRALRPLRPEDLQSLRGGLRLVPRPLRAAAGRLLDRFPVRA